MFIIVAFALLLLLPSPWNFVGFAIGLALFAGEVFYWNGRVRGRRAAVGVQTMIGEVATVISACRPTGQVGIAGEIWAARCNGGADPGDTVTIVGRDRLTLIVEQAGPAAQPASA